jgi:methionyl-tRNA synthetase
MFVKMEGTKNLVTAALPYANGQMHIGHVLEHIQADIFARFLKLLGKDVLYICGSDMHGTPVEINAKKAGKEPREFALKFWKEQKKDFSDYLAEYDNYYHTDTPENKELAELFYSRLKEKNLIYTKKIKIIYCESCARSLPDRFVKGTCPHCTTLGQYGDVCESCGVVLKGVDLINPKCSLCGKSPVQRESEHYFFKLSKFAGKLEKWINSEEADLQPEVKNWLKGWLEQGLDDWCISRDAPYFGFEIPGAEEETGEKKYFYVWLDAPIGYLSSTKNYCDKVAKGKCEWEDYWYKGKVHHFIGKDISYFHFLFWPAILMAVGIPIPKLTVHGFVTVNGKKMSKSRGTFFTAKDFLKEYSAESLRYYYASKLGKKLVDIDIDFEDFKASVNNVLVGNLGNFIYRTLSFIDKNYNGEVKDVVEEKKLEKEVLELIEEVKEGYNSLEYKDAINKIMRIADLGNSYFQKAEPWKNKEGSVGKVAWCANLVRVLGILIKPVLPEFSASVEKQLGVKELGFSDLSFGFTGKLGKVKILVDKIEKVPQSMVFPLDMKVGLVKEVKDHPGADSLYLLKVDFGDDERQVVAGLKKYLTVGELQRRKAVFVINMKPAKLRGEKSEAMILVGDDGERVELLNVEKSVVGDEVKFEGFTNNKKQITFDDFKKIKMLVNEGKVVYESKELKTSTEDVLVKGLKDGSRIS